MIGILGAVFGARASLKDTRSKRERKFVWLLIVWCSVLVGGLLAAQFFVSTLAPEVYRTGVFQGIIWGSYSILLVSLIIWGNRRQQQIRKEDGTLKPEEEQNKIQPVSAAAFRGSQAGSIFGSTCWIWIAAGLAGDWITVVIAATLAVAIWWLVCFPLFRAADARNQFALYRLSVVFVGALGVTVVSLRWSSWKGTPALHSIENVSPWLVNLMLVSITLGILFVLRLRESQMPFEEKS